MRPANYTDMDISFCKPKHLNIAIDERPNRMFSFLHSVDILQRSVLQIECVIKSDLIQRFLRSDQKFDLILSEYFHNRIFASFSVVFNAPIAFVSVCRGFPWVNSDFGNVDNPSYVPHSIAKTGAQMGFFDRVLNTLEYATLLLTDEFILNKISERIVGQHLGHVVPPLKHILKNGSVVFVNSHFSYFFSKAAVPSVIEVGGVHIREPEALPQVNIFVL